MDFTKAKPFISRQRPRNFKAQISIYRLTILVKFEEYYLGLFILIVGSRMEFLP
jgi:hypothetical protein